MITEYLLSSPEGDLTLDSKELKKPFKLTPTENHPTLTLGDYFRALEAFLLIDRAGSLIKILVDRLKRPLGMGDIDKVWICSEKHGALHHIASIDIFIGNVHAKYALSTAVSARGRACLRQEHELLETLSSLSHSSYLPDVYFGGGVSSPSKSLGVSLYMLLTEWFEDYYEWHLSVDPSGRVQKICLWDMKEGYRYLSEKEAFRIFRQASKILTLYYGTESYKHIAPWHHAAGDFVVKAGGDKVEVKLTTVRGYDPILSAFEGENPGPFIAIVYFLLNLLTRMRLDKLDGTGEPLWAPEYTVEAAVGGFFEALAIMKVEGRYHLGEIEELDTLLKSFSRNELAGIFEPLLGLYHDDDPADLFLIKEKKDGHTSEIYQAIQRFHV